MKSKRLRGELFTVSNEALMKFEGILGSCSNRFFDRIDWEVARIFLTGYIRLQ